MARLKNVSNADILNVVSEGAAPALATALEGVEKASTLSYENAFINLQNENLLNEFVPTLINRIGKVLVDNLKTYKNPMVNYIKDDLLYGDSVEEVSIHLAKSHQYQVHTDPKNPGDVFAQNIPDMETGIHKINYEQYFPETINDVVLKRAFIHEGGLAKLTSGIMTAMVNAANNELFQIMQAVMVDAYKYGDLRQLQVEDPELSLDNLKKLGKKMRNTFKRMQFMQSDYNVYELDTFSLGEDIHTFILPELESDFDFDVLAYAYNQDRAKLLGQVNVIQTFGDTPIKAIMLDKDALVFYQTLYMTSSIYDPKHLSTNLFLHVQGIYSFSRFLNAVAFTTEKVNNADVTAVSVTAETDNNVTKGQTKQCNATVTGDGSQNKVWWRVEGNKDNTTYINDKGVLYCGTGEKTGQKITVTAYAKENTKVKGKVILTVK